MAMPACALHVVDVFAERPLAGNPLAVVVADRLPDADLRQAIARETNLSETTFLGPCADPDDAWSVRIHTPVEELPFAGHPVLGTAWVIRERLLEGRRDQILLRTGMGCIPVTFDGEGSAATGWLQAPPAQFAPLDVAELDGVIAPDCLRGPLPARIGCNGPTMMLVSAADAAALDDPIIDAGRLATLLGRSERTGVLLAAPLYDEARPGRWRVRVFFLADALREDPATGSAAAMLGECLRANGYLGDCLVEQGAAMRRPSSLHLRIPREGAIEVGGRVQSVWSGRST